jgi:hypothetical protein
LTRSRSLSGAEARRQRHFSRIREFESGMLNPIDVKQMHCHPRLQE